MLVMRCDRKRIGRVARTARLVLPMLSLPAAKKTCEPEPLLTVTSAELVTSSSMRRGESE
jgi:hypothetical protein